MTAPGPPEATEGPEGLLRLAVSDPASAYASARAFLDRVGGAARGGRDGVVASRAAALAAKELGSLDEGIGLLREALAHARGYDAALVRMNLVGLLAASGDFEAALAEAARAEGVLRGADADRLSANVACALARAGRLAEADAVASRTLPRLRGGGDPAALAGLLTNLGLARALRGDLDAAEAALTEAVAAGEEAGLRHLTAMARGNLAFVASRRGDIPRALRLFAVAEPGLAPERVAQCRFDVAETLIRAGLPGEARSLLEATLAAVDAGGYRCDVADGLLLLGHAELADGDAERAAETAERARAAFADQGRTGWTLPAEHLLLRARWAAGDRSAVFLRSAEAAADRLHERGWAETAAEARIIAARVALTLGRPAGHLLKPVARAREHGPAALRAAAWHATALERSARHDHDGARAAVRAGLRVVEEYAAVFGALELRARAAGLGAELADLGLRAARSPKELLEAEERRRALACPASLRPPRDPVRAAALTELRALSARRTAELAEGGARDPDLPDHLVRLESLIRVRTWSRQGGNGARRRPTLADLISALGARLLVELIQVGEGLQAVTVRDGQVRRYALGPYERVVREARLCRFTLRRHVQRDDPDSLVGLKDAVHRLDDLLLRPLGVEEAEGVVVAPTGLLHGLPWGMLPCLQGRPHTVVPSATAWLHARETDAERRRGERGPVVLASGPGLDQAETEVRMIADLYPEARPYTGRHAEAEAVRDALDGADLAHIAAHGEFRDGGMLFSSLRMADGPLLLADLEELETPPRVVVLSACDLGRDAVEGMVGALLALGTATVIASVTPVRDADAPPFMAAFHTALTRGLSPARALARATIATSHPPGVGGFTCYGAD